MVSEPVLPSMELLPLLPVRVLARALPVALMLLEPVRGELFNVGRGGVGHRSLNQIGAF